MFPFDKREVFHFHWMTEMACDSSPRIGGSIPIVYTYFTEFLQMDKRGEHLSWLCMFWMLGGLYASFTAWGIIPHYGSTYTLCLCVIDF